MTSKNIFFIFIATLLMLACGSAGCYENRTSIPKAGFYAYNMPENELSVDSILVYGVGQKNNEYIVSNGKDITLLSLPFRNDSDTTQYVIKYEMQALAKQNICDTLTFIYTRYPHFISADCGVAFYYDMKEVQYTQYMLDSAAIVVDEVTNVDQETMRLYYYVAL